MLLRVKGLNLIPLFLQVILSSSQNGAFLENAIPLFLKVLKDEKPFFIAEKAQQVSFFVDQLLLNV